jgi:hypothetical protein
MSTINNELKSRWGYHPCDYETFQKLRVIKKYYYKNLHVIAERDRWLDKEPQNRVIRTRHTFINRGGKLTTKVIGSVPRPEPKPMWELDNARFAVELCNLARIPQPKPIQAYNTIQLVVIFNLYKAVCDFYELTSDPT